MSSSLRRTMMLRVVLAMVLTLLVSGWALNHFVASDMRQRFDTRLLDLASLLISEVEAGRDGIRVDFEEFDLAAILEAPGADVLQVTGADDQVIYHSDGEQGKSLPVPELAVGEHAYTDTSLSSGRRLRCVHLAFYPENHDRSSEVGARPGSPELTLTIGRDRSYLSQALLRFDLIMVVVAILTILVLVLTELALIRASLAPVESLATDIAVLDVMRPGTRLTTGGIPRDFQPIVDRLNEMVGRVEQAFAREQKFAADFSHEMRTPLAGLRTTLEVGLLQTRTPEEYRRTLRECLSMSAGMEKVTETMLTLKRIEEGGVGVGEQPVEASELVEEILATLADRISRKRMSLEVSVPRELRFTTDRALFALALRNVVDNAVSHGEAGGLIWIQGASTASESFLEVANSGCSLTQDQAESLRARFRRGDSNRDANTGHSGLGLAVVDEVARVLGISVSIHAGGEGIYRLRFTQPSPERL